jgi:F-type H+-transporting ATPase subunit epsilon
MGQFEILTGHAPIISSLGEGHVVYTAPDGKHTIDICGGFVEVQKNNVSLCIELHEK